MWMRMEKSAACSKDGSGRHRIPVLLRQILILLLIALLGGTALVYHIPCLFLRYLHIPCPGCGMTRAVISALHCDFKAAFLHHPMFWSLPVILTLLLTGGKPTRNQKFNSIILYLIGGGFLLQYIIRLFIFFHT